MPFFGGTSFSLNALNVANATDFFPKEATAALSTSLVFLYSIGALVGLTLCSQLMNFILPNSLFLFHAFLAAGFLLVAWLIVQKKKSTSLSNF